MTLSRHVFVSGIPLALVVFGCSQRAMYAVPFLHGTWLASATKQLLFPNEKSSALVQIWVCLAILGILASLATAFSEIDEPSPGWRMVRYAALSVIPAVVLTAVPWFLWPLWVVIPVAVVLVINTSGLAIIYAARLILIRPGFNLKRAGLCGTTLSWSALLLVAFDWVNLLLIGGT